MSHIDNIIKHFKNGEFVIVMDDLNRENEGDLIIAAEYITPEKMNFLIKNTTGIICCPMTQERANQLRLHKMTANNTDKHCTNFTVTCDAINNITTGVSAHDRSYTANLLANYSYDHSAFSKPGHMFPLIAQNGGVLIRKGHTEAAVDLCLLAELTPVGVIGELMNNDGTMSRLNDCQKISKEYDIPIITIEDLITYRKSIENTSSSTCLNKVVLESECNLHIDNYNDVMKCNCNVFWSSIDNLEHTIVLYGDCSSNKSIPVRIHSECFTGNVLHSLHCDCHEQLEKSFEIIKNIGYGIVIYNNGHEGRGIGLSNKIKAYKLQQEKSFNTIDANLHLNLPNDSRNYDTAYEILKFFNIKNIDLITNNPDKINYFKNNLSCDINITSTINISIKPNTYNVKYLQTKKNIMNHSINFNNNLKNFELIDFTTKKHIIKNFKIAIIKTTWNKNIINNLLQDCKTSLMSYGINEENIVEYDVPGACELIFQSKQIMNLDYNCIITLGAIIKGDTPHFKFISQAVVSGIINLQIVSPIPIVMGVLTCDTYEQAFERSDGKKSLGKGYANTAIHISYNNIV
jgi:3,4-dihydroxy 2-butanone 4-phosphate synthase/GTP cyclohydrolase II